MAETEKKGTEADGTFLTLNGVPVYFSEDWNVGIGGGLWSTGLAMATYFDEHADDVANNLKHLQCALPDGDNCNGSVETEREGLTVLELGSGNGFLSVCLLALTVHHSALIKELVVTDMADHLDLIATTLKANSHVWDELIVVQPHDDQTRESQMHGTTNDGRQSKIHSSERRLGTNNATVVVAEHLWGTFPSDGRAADAVDAAKHDTNKKYDFIFGTDLAYRNSLHAPLIATLARCSHPRTVCLIGVTMADTQPAFFDALTTAGFRYEKLAEHLLGNDYRGRDFGIIAIQRR